MNPTIAAIATMYAGMQFRSRLEARWAAMFDLLGWVWDYEPHDLPKYVADFVVWPAGRAGRPVLIECKPEDTVEGLAAARERVLDRAAGWMLSDLTSEQQIQGLALARIRQLDDDARALELYASLGGAMTGPLPTDVEHFEAWCMAIIDDALAHLPDGGRSALDKLPAARSALVVGPQLFAEAALDGVHVLVACPDHVGIIDLRRDAWFACVACGSDDTKRGGVPMLWAQELFREAANVVQWRAPANPTRADRGPGPLRAAPRSCARCGTAFAGFTHHLTCSR